MTFDPKALKHLTFDFTVNSEGGDILCTAVKLLL